MADQRAVLTTVGVEVQGQVVDHGLAVDHTYPGGQRVGGHQRMKGCGVVLFEMGGQVHGLPSVNVGPL
jgi:hypothetical protein